jgi:hypothetical protein
MVELVFERKIITALLLSLFSFSVPVRQRGNVSAGAECPAATLDDDCVGKV